MWRHLADPTASYIGIERRQAQRYSLALPVDLDDGSGTTQDISEYGIRFVTHQRYALGQPITFTLRFRNLTDGEATWRIPGAGRVVRSERDGVQLVVAIAVSQYGFPES